MQRDTADTAGDRYNHEETNLNETRDCRDMYCTTATAEETAGGAVEA